MARKKRKKSRVKRWLIKLPSRAILLRSTRKPRVLRVVKRQSGSRKSIRADRLRKALKPGKRISRFGRIYWETRRNRSDLRGRL